MAAANSDQENVLLQSDEGSPSAPPPAGRLPFKAALAVGLCVFAAGLAGAVMMGRPAARAPINIWHRWSAPTKIRHRWWSAIGLSDHPYWKYTTQECADLLVELEEEALEQGRTHEADTFSGGTLDCKEESEQACTTVYSMYGTDFTQEKCFPAVCKEANIFKSMEALLANAPPEAELSGLEVSCSGGGEETDGPSPTPSPAQDDGDDEHEFKHMTKECVDDLEALEKEAEEEGRTHEAGSFSPGTLDCKEESEQACTVTMSMYGMDITQEKCFPAVCKEENIFKEVEASTADAPPEAELSGLEVSCSGGDEETDGPSPTPSPAQDDGDYEHEFKHMTKECVDILEALEKEAEEEGRTHETGTFRGGTLDCKEESEQACTMDYSMYGMNLTFEKCFPAVCKEANIFKEMEVLVANAPEAGVSGLEVSCSGGEEAAKSRAGQCGPEVGLLAASVLVTFIFAQ